MADFKQALIIMLKHEGRYSIDHNDHGGETYKGISRVKHPNWSGWQTVDSVKNVPNINQVLDDNIELQNEVEYFYKINFWNPILGDCILDQDVANSIFDFGVNAGVHTSIQFTQDILLTHPDGVMGPISLRELNSFPPKAFLSYFTLSKIRFYNSIAQKRLVNKNYLSGWINRAMKFCPI